MDLMKRFILKSRIHRGACLLYVASVISLLAIHFWFAVTEHLSCFQLFVDFVLPFLILSPLYGLVWRKNLLAKLLLYHGIDLDLHTVFTGFQRYKYVAGFKRARLSPLNDLGHIVFTSSEMD